MGLETAIADIRALLRDTPALGVVATLIPRSQLHIAATHAILDEGRTYLGLDPAMPDGRLSTYLEIGKASVVLCAPELESRAALLAANVLGCRVVVAVLGQRARGEGAARAPRNASSRAYLVFTSGSTGTPKGVQVHWGGLENHLEAKTSLLELDLRDVIAQSAALTFDVHVWQTLIGRRVGAATRVIGPDDAVGVAFFRALAREGITVAQSVPSLLAPAFREGTGELPSLPRLRHLICIGEPLTVDLAAQIIGRYPDVALWNAYGPAECSDTVSMARITREDVERKVIPLGKPLPGVALDVVRGEVRLAEDDTSTGVLVVSGVAVGLGYLDPSQSSGFVDGPVRAYSTGDLVKRIGGQLVYVGRADGQVKINGQRIELGEIETAIIAGGGIEGAAVVAVAEGHTKTLAAFVVPSSDADVDEGALRARLSKVLPPFMVPQRILIVPALPMMSTGKLDRRRLSTFAPKHKEPVNAGAGAAAAEGDRAATAGGATAAAGDAAAVAGGAPAARSGAAPRQESDPNVVRLIAMFAQVAGTSPTTIDPDADLASYGVWDSLVRVAMRTRVEDAFRCTIPPAAWLQCRTLREIVTLLPPPSTPTREGVTSSLLGKLRGLTSRRR